MVTSSWFVSALEARNNIVKDLAVHGEIRDIEHQVMLAVQRGDYEVTITDNTLMTESTPDYAEVFTVDAVTSLITVPSHGFSTGDVVYVSSTSELPPPLTAMVPYYAIYVDDDTIRLAASRADSLAGRPISIDISQGVVSVSLTSAGSGYLVPPHVSFEGGDPDSPAEAEARLLGYGSVYSVATLAAGSGFTDVPIASVIPIGTGSVLGPVTFTTVSVSLVFGGNNYVVNDLLYMLGGAGSPTILRVTAASFGSVTEVVLVDGGNYSVLPLINGCPTETNGFGGGANFVLNMGIKTIAVTAGGSGYIDTAIAEITGGGGSNATARATAVGGVITSVTVTNPGSGYIEQPTVVASTGAGAQVAARLVPTSVNSVVVTNSGGASYTEAPAVTINTIGSGATVGDVTMKTVAATLINPGLGYAQGDIMLVVGGSATAATEIQVLTVDTAGRVLTLNIVNPGSYTTLPQLNANNLMGGSGVGASVNLSMGVNTLAPSSVGSGYTTSPLVLFSGGGGGAGAAAHSRLTAGTVSAYVVTSPGHGYTAVPSVAVSGGSGATAQAVLVPTGVAGIEVLEGGSDYYSPPLVTITGGGGTGATAVAEVTDEAVTAINIVFSGSGYTSAPAVEIEGNATARAILVPTPVGSIAVTNGGSGYTHVPSVTIEGSAEAQARVNPTQVMDVEVINSGAGYTSSPLITWEAGTQQTITPDYPITRVTRSFGLLSVLVTEPGVNYTGVPSVGFSAPASGGATAVAVAALGSGSGLLSVVKYEASKDYFKVWKNLCPSNQMLTRPYTDQMDSVIKYFTDLGYSITRYTNPETNNTLAWSIKW